MTRRIQTKIPAIVPPTMAPIGGFSGLGDTVQFKAETDSGVTYELREERVVENVTWLLDVEVGVVSGEGTAVEGVIGEISMDALIGFNEEEDEMVDEVVEDISEARTLCQRDGL